MKQLDLFENKEASYEKILLDKEHYIEIYRQVDLFKLDKDSD